MNSSTSSSEALSGQAGTHYLRVYAASCLLFGACVGLFNYAVDPLQFYRRAAYPPVFSENQRYQNPGLARNYPYETVVIGTSHAENLLPGDIETILGERAIKLAIAGSTAREQRMTLELALATGRTKHVIWVLNFLSFRKPADALGRAEDDFPHHLYGGPQSAYGLRTLGVYLLSLDTLTMSADALLGRGRNSLDALNTWHRESAFGEARVLADWQRRGAIIDAANRTPGAALTQRVRQTRESVRTNLLPLLEANPDVRFDLVFPPYSVLLYLADMRSFEGAYAERLAYKAFIVRAVAGLANVQVHDFQGRTDITHDLARYKDLEHFDLEATREILRAIGTGSARVDAAGYAGVLDSQREKVEAYRARVCAPASPQRGLCPRVAKP